jgi:hypothetical protein
MSNSVESLRSRFFPSNLLPWFEAGAFGWRTLAIGFDADIERTVDEWETLGTDQFPIWIYRPLHAVLAHDRSSGYLFLSIQPSQLEVDRELAFLSARCL